MVGGLTYAFFNYTKTGSANTLKLGTISFSSSYETVTLTNVFPITSTAAETDTDNVETITVNINGKTTYSGGVEYLVTLTDVNVTVGSKTVPVSLIVTPSGLGESDSNYFTNRGGETKIYRILAGDTLENNEQVLVGFIPNSNTGTTGTVTIKAYLDSSKLAISDTYDGTESDNMGTTSEWVNGRTVLTTTEWNSLGTTPISFKVKVEANDGIWVENLNALFNKVKAMSTGTMNSGTDFGIVASSDTTNHPYGVYQLVENGLTSPIYFFRGDHTVNNNVIFDNKCWLVVRTTETNSTRMIYNGTPVDGHCTTTTGNDTMISVYQSDSVNSDGNYDYSYTSKEGFTTLISGTEYSINYNNAKYVGYTYDNGVNSNMKNALEAWYEGAISSEAKAKIETSTYCNDITQLSEEEESTLVTTLNWSSWWKSSYTMFSSSKRAYENTPSVLCPDGANAISSKVGFLTVDEEIMAGRTYSSGMQDYLYNASYWWLGSPYRFTAGFAVVFDVSNDGYVYNSSYVHSISGLRPVVSITSNTEITGGDGSQDRPWIIG